MKCASLLSYVLKGILCNGISILEKLKRECFVGDKYESAFLEMRVGHMNV